MKKHVKNLLCLCWFLLFSLCITAITLSQEVSAADFIDLGTVSKANPSVSAVATVKSGQTLTYTYRISAEESEVAMTLGVGLPGGTCSGTSPSYTAIFDNYEGGSNKIAEFEIKDGTLGWNAPRTLAGGGLYTITITDVVCSGSSQIELYAFAEDWGGEAALKRWRSEELVMVRLNADSVDLLKGKKKKLTATITGGGSVTWSSSNKKVATVSSSGVVTAKGYGKAVISCRSKKKKDVVATCTVNVTAKADKITLNKKQYSLKGGEQFTLKASVKNKNASKQEIIWKSSNTKVATVDASGTVTGVSKGTATITAVPRYKTKKSVKATCKVTVSYNPGAVEIKAGHPGSNITATYLYSYGRMWGARVPYTLIVGNRSAGPEPLTIIFSAGSKTAEKTITVKPNTTYKLWVNFTLSSSSSNKKISVTLPGGTTQTTYSGMYGVTGIIIPDDFYTEIS